MLLSVKPSSILQLTITGFLAVAGLLIAALVVTADQLTGISDRSQWVVNQSTTALRSSRVLIEQATAMERNIRQYSILDDAEILKVYAERRNTFSTAARQLGSLHLNDAINGSIESLMVNEKHAFEAVSTPGVGQNLEELYPLLLNIAYGISRDIDIWANDELASIRDDAAETLDMLTLQAVALVSTALVLAAIFTALITRPLLQVNKAINQLGSGSYQTPIAIHGPKDLVNLGERLDWLRSRLNKLEQQRTSFLRHVSHELKTPLAAIQESSSLLGDGVVGRMSDEQQEIIRIQGSNCQRLQRLIEDLLRYNLESFSVLNVMPQPLRLDKVVEDVVNAHELALKSRQLSIAHGLEKITIQGDAEQLRVVIDNLMSNAIRFSPEGGTITVSLYKDGDTVKFEVVDQGPGVTPDEAEKIFDAFYQGKVPDREHYKGSGLGLAIAEEYAKANGGSIQVVTSGKGGHFRLLLPATTRTER